MKAKLFRLTRPGAALILATAVGVVAAGCGSSHPLAAAHRRPASALTADLKLVTLRVGEQVKITQSLLAASGEVKGLPFQVSYSEFTSGPPLLEALNANAIDVGGVGDTPVVFSAASGGDIRIVAASSSGGDTADAIVVPPGSTVHSVSQLKGKRVAVAQGSSAQYTLLALLGKEGLKLSEVTPVYLQPAQALAALKGGSIDAWSVWYPYVAVAKAQGARVLETGSSINAGDGFEVSNASTVQNPAKAAALSDFLERLAKAQAWAYAHPTEWAAVYAKLTGLPIAVALETAEHQRARYVPIDSKVISSEQTIADAFAGQGTIPKVDMSNFFDTAFNPAIEAAQAKP